MRRRLGCLALLSLVAPAATSAAPLDPMPAAISAVPAITRLGRVIGVTAAPDGSVLFTNEDIGLFEVRAGGLRLVTGQPVRPWGVALAGSGQALLLAEGLRAAGSPTGLLLRVDIASGTHSILASGVVSPRSVAIGSNGTIYLTGAGSGPGSGTVYRYTEAGGLETFASGFDEPDGVVVLADGSLVVAAAGYGAGANRLEGSAFRIEGTGTVSVLVPERLINPSGLAVDGMGVVFLSGLREVQGVRHGTIVKVFPGRPAVDFVTWLLDPRGMTFVSDGSVVVAEHGYQILLPIQAPPPPIVEALPPYTREDSVHVAGTSRANAVVVVLGGRETALVLASTLGAFDVVVPLVHNQRSDLRVFAVDFYGLGLASPPRTVSLTHDDVAPIVIASAAPPPNGAGWNRAGVTVSFSCTDDGSGIASCPGPVTVSGEGDGQVITRQATDRAGNSGSGSTTVRIDETGPSVTITSPTEGQAVSGSPVEVTGTVGDALSGVATVTCNGTGASSSAGSFTCSVPVSPGNSTIVVSATDRAENAGSTQVTVSLFQATKIGVSITTPASLTVFRTGPVTVEGDLDRPAASVLVNGVVAQLAGVHFTATGVPLVEGHNILTATATGPGGAIGTGSVTVTMDATPPVVRIDAPTDGAIVSTAQVAVTGSVNDIVSGTVNGEQVTVTVNGIGASISNRSFVASDVLLVRGLNTITAVARDRAGNESRTEVEVSFEDVAGQQRLEILGGNNQTGPIGSTLPEPLLIGVVDAFGRAVQDRAVTFTVVKTEGVVRAFPEEGRRVTVVTDDRGQASVLYRLGTRTGAGNNQVAVTAPGFASEVIFTAGATVGPPVRINADAVMGESFRGSAGVALPGPFVAMVFDAGGNPVAGVPVTFTVKQGTGHLDGTETTLIKATDSDGKANVTLTLGAEPGINNNVVSASFEGLAEPPVTYTATALPAGAAEQTRMSGVVLDNTDTPIPNALARIFGTSLEAFTNDQGQFTITGVPVGAVRLEVDGSTSTRPETFPMLAFHLTTVAGQDNTVGMPIYLPPLDTGGSRVVGGDQAVELTMAGVPGVVFTVAPRSVTFRDGSKVGRAILTQVHADKVPMPPPHGTAPRIMWTMQPHGARFDPPVKVQLPNTDGLPPGQVLEIFQFDHDLEQFVSVGPARVSADGSVITSDPGFGITKSGWGGGPPPPPPKNPCTGSCGPCKSCVDGSCVANPNFAFASPRPGAGATCPDNACLANPRCSAQGTCEGDLKEITSVEARVNGRSPSTAAVGLAANFTVTATQNNCDSLTYDWDFGDGGQSSLQNPTHTYATPGIYPVRVTVSCDACTAAKKEATVEVRAFRPTVVSADVTVDQIVLQLEPDGLNGNLRLELGGPATHVIRTEARASGPYTETFNVASLATGEYTLVRAVWTVDGLEARHELPYHIRVLGMYRHSQYNIPEEALCTGGPTNAFATTSACVFTATTLRSQFFSQVNLNGSGVSINHGNIGREFFCVGQPGAPPNAAGRSFRTGVTFTGRCGPLGNDTVAVLPSHPFLSCGNRVLLVGAGGGVGAVKQITDFCPGCAQNQLDNFTTDGRCAGITDFGQFLTIQLF